MTLQFGEVWRYGDLLWSGAINSVLLSLFGGLIGLCVGICGAEAKRAGPTALRWGVTGYVELVRNTPFIVQLFFIFFGLPAFGIRLSAWTAATIALSFNIGAYYVEIIRAGLDSAPGGQMEAAKALGLKPWQAFLKVALPPALGRVYVPLVGQFVLVFLGSAVVSQIAAEELTFQAQFIQSRNFRAFEIYLVVTAIYVAIAFAMKSLLLWAEPFLFRWKEAR